MHLPRGAGRGTAPWAISLPLYAHPYRGWVGVTKAARYGGDSRDPYTIHPSSRASQF
jgi:hypothetical protein